MCLSPEYYAQEVRYKLGWAGPINIVEAARDLGVDVCEEALEGSDGILLKAEWDSLVKRLGNALFSYRVSERIRAQCCAAKRFDKEAYATHVLSRVRCNRPR